MGRGIDFEHLAVARIGADVGLGAGRDVEGEFAVLVQADDALAPLSPDPHELAHRQGVEKLVADDDRRTVRKLFQRLGPGDRHAGLEQQFVLHRRQGRARLQEPDVERGAKVRHDARGPQRVAHQRAPARPQFDQPDGIWRAHGRPDLRRPKADQLAEHLRDLRRGGEIARRAERIAIHVIAVVGMGERQLHVALDGDRALEGDQRLHLVEKGRHLELLLRPRLRAISPSPTTIIGADRTMPMVRPRPRSSRRGSGSRKNSLKMRAHP